MTYDPASERYRVYVKRYSHDTQLDLVATCGSPEALGVALVTLHREDEFQGGTVGVLDRPDPDQKGDWLVSPFGPVLKRRFPLSGDAAQPTQADT